MKNNFLFNRRLDTLATLRRLVDFYVDEHNHVIPHRAFQGQTPAEVFRGEASELPAQLAAKRAAAREQRLDENRRSACAVCPESPPPRRVR